MLKPEDRQFIISDYRDYVQSSPVLTFSAAVVVPAVFCICPGSERADMPVLLCMQNSQQCAAHVKYSSKFSTACQANVRHMQSKCSTRNTGHYCSRTAGTLSSLRLGETKVQGAGSAYGINGP